MVFFTSDNGKSLHTGAKELEQKGHYPSGPLRGYKQQVYEGGHRMPFIVRWPGVVPPGGRCDQLIHQTDIMATLAGILGVKLPDRAGEDSISFLPLLKGGTQPVRTVSVSCASDGTPSIRDGAWKLILPANPAAIELYDLAVDIGETTNLAAQQPDRVARMKAALEKLIVDGRSTPGAPQKNDVEVIRYPGASASAKKFGTRSPD